MDTSVQIGAGAYALFIVGLLGLGFFTAPLFLWSIFILGFGYLAAWPLWLLIALAVVLVIFNIPALRSVLISSGVMALFKKLQIVPKISETERTALDAGVTWIEKDLFSGNPDMAKIMKEPYPSLSAEEQAFMNGPVAKLCEMIDGWEILKKRDIPPHVIEFIKKEKFWGMIIPKEYGGLGFSNFAHSQVVHAVSTRSTAVGVTVMVPNSLGPAELLVHYGTDEQKKHYLPRLANGQEIPCFGLTEPLAGSDAGSISSNGVVFKGDDGKLYIRLNWNKRWITLAAISTTIGLAFKLRDPENFLGKGEDVGITCALIPANLKGVVLGRRHDPLFIPFYNCPTQGKDVVISIDAVVGGVSGCGKGWGMLMDCLAAGRGISLPAQATGFAKLAYRVVSAHSLVRKQFGVSIGKFEGVEEHLAKLGGTTYALEAMRTFTLGALDSGIKPPVITAMQKYYSTEMVRSAGIGAMDILGGAGISMGPRNVMAEAYIGAPIAITVEGANIMTRTLIVFGQGALRSHPYAYAEVRALEANDLRGFDVAFWGHIGHIVRNFCRSVLLSVTRGYLAGSPDVHPKTTRYYQRLQWTSATFAILADVAMGVLGGQLKMKEKLTGRFADIMAQMYIATCVLRRFEAEGRKEEDLAFVHYCVKNCLVEIQKAFDGIFDNLTIPGINWFFKGWMGAWSRINSIGSQASDNWSHVISDSMLNNQQQRLRLTEGIYVPTDRNQQVARLDYAYQMVHKAESIEQKMRAAVKSKTLPRLKGMKLAEEALAKSVITSEEFKLLQETESVRYDAIMVDDFSEDQYHGRVYP